MQFCSQIRNKLENQTVKTQIKELIQFYSESFNHFLFPFYSWLTFIIVIHARIKIKNK